MWFESVPNVSEGRRPGVIDRLSRAVCRATDAVLLDVSSDADHNRTVLTLAGTADGLVEALLGLYDEALRHLDLRRHEGVHPRLGTVDVVPFVPLAGATMGDAIALARRLGETVAERFALPVFYYEHAATHPERRDLAALRRGGSARLAEALATAALVPDAGPRSLHPQAGATVIGARGFLVAFNVVLASNDLRLARRIARTIRESAGGLPGVKAIGLRLRRRGRVQVSMNLVDPLRTPPLTAFERVRDLARHHGVAVLGSEIVGLVPEACLPADPDRLSLEAFGPELVLENRLRSRGLAEALEQPARHAVEGAGRHGDADVARL